MAACHVGAHAVPGCELAANVAKQPRFGGSLGAVALLISVLALQNMSLISPSPTGSTPCARSGMSFQCFE